MFSQPSHIAFKLLVLGRGGGFAVLGGSNLRLEGADFAVFARDLFSQPSHFAFQLLVLGRGGGFAGLGRSTLRREGADFAVFALDLFSQPSHFAFQLLAFGCSNRLTFFRGTQLRLRFAEVLLGCRQFLQLYLHFLDLYTVQRTCSGCCWLSNTSLYIEVLGMHNSTMQLLP